MKQSQLEEILKHVIHKKNKLHTSRDGKYGVIYTRVSTLEQSNSNGSLELQKKVNDEYAKRNGIIIKEYFGGKFESAKTDGRKEFQRMLGYVRKQKDIGYIIITNYDRFSRTGPSAAKLSEDLRKQGIIVKSATQDIDTSTATGRFQENFMHLLNNFDNVSKSERTKLHTKEVMEKGYWPYAIPLVYDNLKKKQRACFHEYIITDKGKELKKAFILKAEGKKTNREIIALLQAKGVRINEKSFRAMINNPFYAGYITGNLVNGKLIKGHHPPLVDLKLFLKANDVLKNAINTGISKVFRHEQIPLKIFAKEDLSDMPFTGYKTKNNWYYKTKSSLYPTNVKAEKLNEQFANFLKQFEFKAEWKSKLKKAMFEKLRDRISTSSNENKLLKKQISEKEGQLEKIEKKYLLDEIDKQIFEKHSNKLNSEIKELSANLSETHFESSNLLKVVENYLGIAQNISGAWIDANFENMQRLQKLVFPSGIKYNKEKDEVRTERVNSLFAQIPYCHCILEENKNGNLKKDYHFSYKVVPARIELASKV